MEETFILQIKPIKSLESDCFQDVVITLSAWLNQHYEMMYVGSLDYQPLTRIEKRTEAKVNINLNALSKYHGLEIVHYPPVPYEDLLQIIKSEINQGMPIGISLDSYYCPWDKKFNKTKGFNHTFLINDLNELTCEVSCIDPYYMVENGKLNSLYLHNHNAYYTISSKNHVTNDIEIKIREVNSYIKHYISGDKPFKEMEHLSDVIRNNFNFEYELNCYEDIGFSPLFINLSQTSKGRLYFSKMLEYLSEQTKSKSLLPYIEELKQISNHWIILRGIFAKMSVKKVFSQDVLSKTSNLIVEIAGREKTCLTNLVSVLKIFFSSIHVGQTIPRSPEDYVEVLNSHGS